ncbi:MAG: winged helix-turn-helix domain-containing protein [Blautia sp.]|uniref:ArsR/SmtB family transcription factor n=1 Tax=Blautia sp. TaxID=1955243 RepID=UPI002E75A97C|nr:winged helix-turn-helix domain-containing protein [Blautia sp.]MEE1442095.1 winged helix-turn-helix domain-containing protein [Blautia sp.]
MEAKYVRKLHPFLETLGLIYMTKNLEAVKADMLDSLEEMNIDGAQFYRQHLSYLENYVQVFEESYSLTEEKSFFFGHNTEFFLTLLAIATELFEAEIEPEHLSQQQIFSVMTTFLKKEKSGNLSASNTLEDWFLLLQSSEYSEDTKWRLLELINNPVKKFQELFEIYTNNRAAFATTFQKNKKHLEKLVSKTPSELSDVICNLASEFHPEPKKVYLTAVFPLMEWITPTIIFQGVLADKLDLYQKNLKNAKEMLPQILKLLGDKSKFEILCLLKSHGRYNLEIAEELQLTPATASHHMSMLLSNHMVTVEKKDGRVYYQLNQETLREIIKCFGEIFL